MDEAPSRTQPPSQTTLLLAEFLDEELQEWKRQNKEFLMEQIYQIQAARDFNRVSPTAILQYSIESLAGTGFQRHLNFMKNVELYEMEFNAFLLSTDRADTDSLHVPFVREGMSNKPVHYRNIPKFQDRMRLENAFKEAIIDMMLLLLVFIVLFASAHMSFQRKNI